MLKRPQIDWKSASLFVFSPSNIFAAMVSAHNALSRVQVLAGHLTNSGTWEGLGPGPRPSRSHSLRVSLAPCALDHVSNSALSLP